MHALDGAWRHDRNEEHRFSDRALDFAFPQTAARDGRCILPEPEVAAQKEQQFALDAPAQRGERPFRELVILPRIAEKSDQFRQFAEQRHPTLWTDARRGKYSHASR